MKTFTLHELYKEWESQDQDSKSIPSLKFKAVEGEISLIADETKSFSIHFGTAYWKGSKSIIIIANDVSPIKRHFKSLDTYKDNLLATVSHDLRTPLNGILGMLELLHEEIEDPGHREKLQITITSSKLLLNMINDILDFSLISKGRLRLKFDSTNLSSLINETVKIMTLQANMKGLKLEVENHLSGIENYIVDSNRLRQVLLNLIGNAIKFTGQGHVILRVFEESLFSDDSFSGKSACNTRKQAKELPSDEINEDDINISMKEKNNPSICINRSLMLSSMKLSKKRIIFEVEDTGVGIKSDDIGKLFKLFSRVTAGHEKNMNGIGLGLVISQSLVMLMNANRQGAVISVTSEFGKGSKFMFPIYIENEPSEVFREFEGNSRNMTLFFDTNPQRLGRLDEVVAAENLESENDSFIKEENKHKLILVVDDDQINLLVASTYLKSLNNEFSFVTAVNGRDAIEKVVAYAHRGKYFDVILMDCNMPIMDGYEASLKLKSMMQTNEIPWTPIVAITANIASTDKEKCYESGMDLFLTKPYLKSQLVTTLDEALRIQN